MKRPLAYISCALEKGNIQQQTEMTNYCRTVYEAGYFPICPPLFLPYFIRDEIPAEHKDGIDMSRDLLKRCHVLVVCGKEIDEGVKNEIAIAQRLKITATTLEGIMTIKKQGQDASEEH